MNYQIKALWAIFALLVVYKFGFNNYNFYYDQFFFLERILILALFILSLLKPAFIIPFTFLFLLTLSQYHYPLGGYSITDIYPLINFFPLLISYLILKWAFFINELTFWRVFIVFHISYYLIPGIAKIEISPNLYEWIFYNDLSNLFNSSIEMGWLTELNKSTTDFISKQLNFLKVPLNLLTVVIEISGVYFLTKAKTFRLYLALTSLFHLLIYLSSGIFFWKWIVINVAFILLSYSFERKKKFEKIFDLKPLYFVIFALISPLFLRPLSLAWYDSKLVEKYEIYLSNNYGKDILVTGNFFKPYDKIFSQNRFSYLLNNKSLVGTYGSLGSDKLFFSDFNPVDFIKENLNTDKNDFNKYTLIEKNQFEYLEGFNNYDPHKKSEFIKFLKNYLTNYNQSPNRYLSLTVPHIHQPNNNFPRQIKGFKVFYKRIFHGENGIKQIKTEELINESL